MHKLNAIFLGRVQGVGFRATTALFARSIDLVGFVENLPGGRVKLTAQGTRAALERYS